MAPGADRDEAGVRGFRHFLLGVVCYEMLTRRRPFKRATENSVAEAILHFIPVPASELNPAVNQAVSQAIHKAMAKQPWHRYAAAKEFAETLQKALRNEPIEIFNPARMRPRLQRALGDFGTRRLSIRFGDRRRTRG